MAVSWFYVSALQSSYFTRMPASVRRGQSVESLVAVRAAWLAGIFLVVNASIFLWVAGVKSIQNSQRWQGVLALLASGAVFICASVLMLAWVIFGFAQW